MHKDLRSFLDTLRGENELVEVDAEVNSHLEIAEIHRRVIDEEGKALFFKKIKGSKFPVVTNLFGTNKRIDLAFGKTPEGFVKRLVSAAEELLPPKFGKLWKYRDLAVTGAKLGTRNTSNAEVLQVSQAPINLEKLPFLQLWKDDGGHFVTLPLVYTESPSTGKHNLGMYRIQRFDARTTGIHWQIHKGGGFHYYEAEENNQPLPVNVNIGGAPALIISAIAPLPEDIPELMLASLLAGEKIETAANPLEGGLRILAGSEFVISGVVPPKIRRLEGPFGDHYGYYSLAHEFPVIDVKAVYHRRDAIFPATVVGKPRQEDYFIGEYLQKLLSPLFPLVMPAVYDLWSYGETGFHSLAAAVVKERYSREALGAGFRILGEGQLTLTKFLLLLDRKMDLRDFREVFEHILERTNWESDFFIFDRTSFDTLDYASGKLNHGSKAMLVGVGEKRRELARAFSGTLPLGIRKAEVFCGGCIVLECEPFESENALGNRVAKSGAFDEFQVIVLHDSVEFARSTSKFLWATWTRFNPSTDIYAKQSQLENNHITYQAPIVIDARMKPWYPAEVEVDEETRKLVDSRWKEYFPL
ncbi:MAG: UbiD family decarboxylase [Pyrinomonadaceae bacterium]